MTIQEKWKPCTNTHTHDSWVMGLTPSHSTIVWQLWASCSHACASITKQYNSALA